MLRIILILLFSVLATKEKYIIIFSNSAQASQLERLPEKRPSNLFNYEESLKSIHDIIEKEGGKKIGNLKKNKITNGENLSKFLSRVGFSANESKKIISSIKSQKQSLDLFRKIPANLLVKYSLPNKNLGGSLEFRFKKNKDIYVWQNHNNDYVSKITKRPTARNISFDEGIIKTSLYNSSKKLKMPEKTFVEMISILGFAVDFQRDIRIGDKFEILYTKETDLIDNKIINTSPIEYVSITLTGKNLSYYRFKTPEGYVGYFDENGFSSKKTLMKTPLNGARLSSGYGSRKHPILGYTKMHRGLDFAAPKGTPVFAAGDGVVEFSGWNGSYGKYIRIRHNGNYKTAYAHLMKTKKRKFQKVSQGEVIGFVGSTGRSTGPHLHYEVLFSGRQVNPMRIKLPSGKNVPKKYLSQYKNHVLNIKSKIYLATLSKENKNSLAFSKIKDNKNKIN